MATIAGIFYIVGIVRGEIRPQKSTWIVWTIVGAITLGAMYQEDTLNAQIVTVTLADFIILVLSFKYGTAGWNKLDIASMGVAAVAIALWMSTGNATTALVLALGTIAVGSFPTFAHTWKNPGEENALPWAIMLVSSICLVFTLSKWNIDTAGQPILYLIIPGTVLAFILRGHLGFAQNSSSAK